MAEPIKIKNLQQIREAERCLEIYFSAHIAPMMEAAKAELQRAQASEIRAHQSSFAGLMRSLAAASNPAAVDDPLLHLQCVGGACAKTAEDYVAMVADKISGDADCQADLARLASEWRDAIVRESGRGRYDEISSRIGADLALAYADHRVERMIIDKMARDQMPKSAADYIIRKGAENSLLGLSQALAKSPLQAEIDAKAEAAFHPSGGARLGVRGLSLGLDLAATGGAGSWSGLAGLLGMEVAFAGMESFLDAKAAERDGLTVEQCVSHALWGTKANVFEAIRKHGPELKPCDSERIRTVSSGLAKKLPFADEKPAWDAMELGKPVPMDGWPAAEWGEASTGEPGQEARRDADRSGIPLVIAIGKEDEYRRFAASIGQQWPPRQDLGQQAAEDAIQQAGMPSQPGQEQPQAAEPGDNSPGWPELLQVAGLGGMGDIGRNLPYVIAMLPDMLAGLLTGKTKSVTLKGELIPIASILLGLFVKNPLLKLALIGLGGGSLLSKMGREAIGRQEQPGRQFRQYADEPLNPRIASPQMRGNVMVATIDGIPCAITVSGNAAAAWAAGSLPINVLANAILAKHDEARATVQDACRAVQGGLAPQPRRGVSLR